MTANGRSSHWGAKTGDRSQPEAVSEGTLGEPFLIRALAQLGAWRREETLP